MNIRLSPPARARRPQPPTRRRLLGWGAAGAGALAGAAWWRTAADHGPGPRGRLTMSTGVPSGVYVRYGQLLQAQLARELPGMEVVLLPSEGSLQNIQRLVSGEADITIATADSLVTYQLGGGPESGRLRALARLYDDYMQLVVPAGSPVESAAGLAGLRVGVGQDGSGVQLVARQMLSAAGLDMEEDLRPVREGIHTMPRLLENNRLDAFFWSGGLPTSAVEKLSLRMDIRLVPLGELLSGLHVLGQEGAHYRAAVVPADVYPDIRTGGAVDTIAVANLLVAMESLDGQLTEHVTRAVISGRDRIAEEVHAAQRVDLRTAVYTRPLELHEGAVRYYRSVKS
ncbi:TAXI family TRAP transporter solute-binding subunit [Streptomyces sp. YIM 98790]|uniref:TAXI family TRAP transporter solute-binding subunit n=1 Tax=Streptomyces sp. YIM 98790 TaxID=2689077 RepID=UPI0028BF56B0|nr:TAXI family TRAP transporter solute-binding subunit [Streptomyces sp. YIM 98790]